MQRFGRGGPWACPSVSGDVQSHTAILETDGCAWMITHMHQFDLCEALKQQLANFDQLFSSFPHFQCQGTVEQYVA
jgi:hypothetical protein